MINAKIISTFLIILLAQNLSFGQKKLKDVLFFNELNLSINHSLVKNDNTSSKIGFGFGLYRICMTEKKLNLVTGFSYDKTAQLKKIVYNGHYSSVYDVKYTLHNISVPLKIRFNIGNSVKLFLESGLFIGFNIGTNREGTFHTSLPNQALKIEHYKEKVSTRSIDCGFSSGLGLNIPLGKYNFLLKTEYQFGIGDYGNFQETISNRYLRFSLGFSKY